MKKQQMYKIVDREKVRNYIPAYIYLEGFPVMKDGVGVPLPYMKVPKKEFKKIFLFSHTDNNDNVYILKPEYKKLLKLLKQDIFYLFNLSLKVEENKLRKEIKKTSEKYKISEDNISALILLMRRKFKKEILAK